MTQSSETPNKGILQKKQTTVPERTLDGLHILFICCPFFGYERAIAQAMTDLGANVTLRDDRPFNASWFKALLRLIPWAGRIIASHYHCKWLRNNPHLSFDRIVILKGEGISVRTLKEFRQRFPKAECILYLWDSLNNVRGTESKLPYFHRAYSFDPVDCKSNTLLRYRPLFFAPGYWTPDPPPGTGAAFIGTLNGDRPRVLYALLKALGPTASAVDWSLFVRSRLELKLRWLTDPSVRNLEPKRFIFKPLPAVEVARRCAASAAVLDIHHPRQSGLTMRTFEVLASGKKLITTNQTIQNEPFFDPRRILCVDRDDPHLPEGALEPLLEPIGRDFLERYSLSGWLNDILQK